MQSDTHEHPRQVFGYQVEGILGQGAASVIYAVCRPGSGQLYALKHVVCRSEKERRFADQVRNEYEIGSVVRCPGLRKPLEFLSDGSWLHKLHEVALVMELFDGVCLEQYRPLASVEAIHCGLTVGRVFHQMHEAGYLHCDMKPANLLMNENGDVCVIDLGQACRVGTVKKRIQGTPAFMAPEQFLRRPVAAHSDIYNLGATLYWLLTHKAITTACTLDKGENSFLVDTVQASPHDLDPSISESLSRLVMKCVRTNPEHRPRNMEEVIRPLETIAYMLAHTGHASDLPHHDHHHHVTASA